MLSMQCISCLFVPIYGPIFQNRNLVCLEVTLYKKERLDFQSFPLFVTRIYMCLVFIFIFLLFCAVLLLFFNLGEELYKVLNEYNI